MSKRRIALLLTLLLAVPLLSQAQNAKKKNKKAGNDPEAQQVVNLPPATIAGELPGERASDAGKQSDWPAIAYSSDGSLYAICVEWNDKDADRIVVRRRTPAGIWDRPIAIADGNWDHYSPTIVGTARARWPSGPASPTAITICLPPRFRTAARFQAGTPHHVRPSAISTPAPSPMPRAM